MYSSIDGHRRMAVIMDVGPGLEDGWGGKVQRGLHVQIPFE